MAKLSLGQMSFFVREWYAGIGSNGQKQLNAPDKASELIAKLVKWPNLRAMGQVLQFLALMCRLDCEGEHLENRATLYDSILKDLMGRWSQQSDANAAPPLLERLKASGMISLTENDLRSLLHTLGHRARKSAQSCDIRGQLDRGVIREEIITNFRRFGLKIGPAAEQSEQVLAYLTENALLEPSGEDTYRLTDYEIYLAACYLVDQKGRRPDFLTLAYINWRENPQKWREVIFLALQQLACLDDNNTVAAWLQLLIAAERGDRKRTIEERASATLFAAECVAELGGKSALQNVTTLGLSGLWQDLNQALIAIIKSSSIDAHDRVKAGAYLCRLGDPRDGVCTSLPEMVTLAAASFVIGSSAEEMIEIHDANDRWLTKQSRNWYLPADALSDQINDQPVHLAAFAISRYPITNNQYARFVADHGYDPARPWWDAAGRAWLERDEATITVETDELFHQYRHRSFKHQPEYWDHPRLGKDQANFPVVGISWYEAQAYCRWLTNNRTYNRKGYIYRLASEAEWEFAARGEARRRFPWGDDEPDAERANFYKQFEGTTSVGCFPGGATPNGIHDMAGNVYEWTGSLYRSYPYDPGDDFDRTADPIETGVIMRGGGWRDPLIALFAACRNYFVNRGAPPDCYFDKLGFRLARSTQV